MKLGDKEIKTGLEIAREGQKAVSIVEKIEEGIRKMLIEKFGYILSPYEIGQITGREKDRGKRREDAITRSQWNIMRSKERAMLRGKISRDIQEGKLFEKELVHKKNFLKGNFCAQSEPLGSDSGERKTSSDVSSTHQSGINIKRISLGY